MEKHLYCNLYILYIIIYIYIYMNISMSVNMLPKADKDKIKKTLRGFLGSQANDTTFLI